jgi:hypothetical protein
MDRRIRIGFVAIVASAVVGSVTLAMPSREPVYQGKPLSHWVKKLGEVHRVGDRMFFTVDAPRNMKLGGIPAQLQHEHAAEALRRIGTNAIPELMAMLDCKDSRFKRKVMRWANELASKQGFFDFRYRFSEERRFSAIQALSELGPQAKLASPKLLIVAQDSNLRIHVAAVEALKNINPKPSTNSATK